ncbi:MAG: UDP-2,3-diacylglucosamine diphosphatase LpxI [Planctomycetota bacterium]
MQEKKIGLVAGWGEFPISIARTLVQQGHEVHCCAIRDHADPRLAKICTSYQVFGMGRMGGQVRFLKRHGVRQATMAGKIFKTLLFQKRRNLFWHFPDLTFLRHFYPVYISRTKDQRDDTLLLTVVDLYAAHGIEFAPATDFAPELLVHAGVLTQKKPSRSEQQDIEFGWQMAKQMGGLDIGQTVVVKNQAVMAVEAIEGTDACIRRAGELCQGGFTVVKVAKPGQDMRFDVPTIGELTVETIHAAGGNVLAVEADKTILLEPEQTIAKANRLGMTIVALEAPVPSDSAS